MPGVPHAPSDLIDVAVHQAETVLAALAGAESRERFFDPGVVWPPRTSGPPTRVIRMARLR